MGSALVTSAAHADSGWKYAISSIKVVDLGTMGGKESVANDINDLGEIVGWANLPDGSQHAFLFRNGVMGDLTPLRGMTSAANGINNFTAIVGYLQGATDYGPHAFYKDLKSLVIQLDEDYKDPKNQVPQCGHGAVAIAINDFYTIAGNRYGGCYPPGAYIARAARWQTWAAPWEEIDPQGSSPRQNYAKNINSAGTILVRDRDSPSSYAGGFQWNPGFVSGVPLPSVAAPAIAVPLSLIPNGINESNGVVGSVSVGDAVSPYHRLERAFYWNGYTAESTLLPQLFRDGDSAANEINTESFSVGYGDDARDRWAVVWHPHIGIKTLTLPPGAGGDTVSTNYQCEALAVNNRSETGFVQAVGFCNVGGNRHAMLWNIATYKYTLPSSTP